MIWTKRKTTGFEFGILTLSDRGAFMLGKTLRGLPIKRPLEVWSDVYGCVLWLPNDLKRLFAEIDGDQIGTFQMGNWLNPVLLNRLLTVRNDWSRK